ncbi:hypothetical protein [Streptomyces rubellomurinus]|uniref:Uncharacterized protein n=1 Tax=Streptomyces rubellomurinus (strain ATCC 31215) TaxID=359131 RepID=A0A0F2T7V3_STRR3|nr:hypothetical protein [Streptomyces rubellomurinus]KJS58415.1 hypothetical protein VM95_33430 [Streptomyces rubellomurinus]
MGMTETQLPSPATNITSIDSKPPVQPEHTLEERPIPVQRRLLDLVALVCLLTIATTIYVIAGTNAGTVTSVGLGLFATWRSNRPT